MKHYTKLILISSILATLTGCSYFKKPPIIQGRNKQYLAAHSIEPLRVPPGLSSSKLVNEYPVPPGGNYPDSAKVVSTIPPGLNSN